MRIVNLINKFFNNSTPMKMNRRGKDCREKIKRENNAKEKKISSSPWSMCHGIKRWHLIAGEKAITYLCGNSVLTTCEDYLKAHQSYLYKAVKYYSSARANTLITFLVLVPFEDTHRFTYAVIVRRSERRRFCWIVIE